MLNAKTTEVMGYATAAAIGVGIGYAIGKNRGWKCSPEAFQKMIEKHNSWQENEKTTGETKAEKKAKKKEEAGAPAA